MYSMTLNPGFGSAVEVDGLGIFLRGETRQVDLADAHLEQFARGKMWTVEQTKAKKPAVKPAAKE